MKLHIDATLKMSMVFIAILLYFSCSKDSDLFDEYVLLDDVDREVNTLDGQEKESEAVDDAYQVTSTASIILDVLSNDTFKTREVAITDTSEPSYGSVAINKNNTLTYIPDQGAIQQILNTSNSPTSELLDMFTYTAELIENGKTIETKGATVRVSIILPTSGSSDANLLFSSGFEGDVVVNAIGTAGAPSDYQYITGTDSETGFTWGSKMIPAWGDSSSGIHTIFGNSTPNDIIENVLVNTTSHDGSSTKALRQTKTRQEGSAYGGPGSQTPFQINNIQNGPNETYFTWWHKYDDLASLTESGNTSWRMLWQYKTRQWDQPSGFRTSIFVQADKSGRLYWSTVGDTKLPQKENIVWRDNNFTVPVPKEQWFKIEIYVKWSQESDGILWAKVNGQEIAYHQGANIGSGNDSLRWVGIWQFYGPGKGQQWIDDYEIWDGLPY